MSMLQEPMWVSGEVWHSFTSQHLNPLLSERPSLSPSRQMKVAMSLFFPSPSEDLGPWQRLHQSWVPILDSEGSSRRKQNPRESSQAVVAAETRRVSTERVAVMSAGSVSVTGVGSALKVLRWLHFLIREFLCVFFVVVFCLFFSGCTCGIWKFLGQGLNLSCSWGQHHSHKNAGSKPHLQPTLKLVGTLDPWRTEQGQRLNPHAQGYYVKLLICWTTTGTLASIILFRCVLQLFSLHRTMYYVVSPFPNIFCFVLLFRFFWSNFKSNTFLINPSFLFKSARKSFCCLQWTILTRESPLWFSSNDPN